MARPARPPRSPARRRDRGEPGARPEDARESGHPTGEVVSDAGPLISLARIGEHEILPRVYGEILITPAVFAEITLRGPGAAELASVSWLRILQPGNTALVEQLMGTLHSGEAEAIVLAEELGALLLVDDQQARRVALRRGIEHTGTAASVVRAGIVGVIPIDEVEPMLRRLQADGMRLSDAIIESVLERLRPGRPS